MKADKKPEYDSYREVIDELYPSHRRLIALNKRATHCDAGEVTADLEDQIEEDILKQYPQEKLDVMLDHMQMRAIHGRHVGMGFVGVMYGFPRYVERPESESKGVGQKTRLEALLDEPVSFTYIALDERPVNPREQFHRFSTCEIPSYRMKFNIAAMNPDMDKWHTFYHELCHAVIRLGVHDYPKGAPDDELDQAYYKAMEESVCDNFAALHILKNYGDSAIPYLKTFADMRLSRFYQEGHSYYTGPAIHKIITQYQEGKLQSVLEDNDAIFAKALKTAKENYVEPEAFRKSYPVLKKLDNIRIRMLGGPEVSIEREEAILKAYGYTDAENNENLGEKEKEMQHYLKESALVLERDYKEDFWKASWGSVKRVLQGPLYKIGWCAHPGF